MSNTYSQIYIHVVFAVQGRQNLLQKPWRNKVFAYISGVLTKKGQKSLIVNGVADHVHVFFQLKPNVSLSEIVRDIKNSSTHYINDNKWLKSKFGWQSGYGAFSYSISQMGTVYRYVENQEIHHQKRTFKDEYLELLKKFEIEFSDQYLFKWIE